MATAPRYQPLPGFVLRSPTLPFAVLAAGADAQARRAALRARVEDPVVREALFVASPELDAQIPAWLADPETPSGVAVERALVRYVSRMAARATPFGLFAAVSVGAIGARGAATSLAVPGRAAARRHTRLDNDLLLSLCADLARDPAARARLRFRPNSSLYLAAARLRYAEARLAERARTYHLVAVDRTGHLEAVLARAEGAATRDELIDVLCGDPEITRDDAGAFVDEVIDAQLVVPELAPTVTGREPTDAMIATLEAAALDALAAPLRFARDRLRAIDAAAPGVAAEAYRAIEHHLAAALPTRVDASRLFQVDLHKPAPGAVLGDAVVGELVRAVETLHAITPAQPSAIWAQFRERFTARYETREVPLLEVLDEDAGIGFGHPEPAAVAPLLAGLAFPTRVGATATTLGRRDAHLMALVSRALQDGATEIELGDRDLELLAERAPLAMPRVFGVLAQLAADSTEAIAAGRYQLRIDGTSAGASLLGRFCHGSPEVTALTERCLRAEEAERPDAVFAEIVHLPEGRVGNILLRPVLRDYEIPYLGASGADRDRQIDVSDLVVTVIGDRVVLRSRQLGREVIPRLTAAHHHASPRNLGVYRFLCAHAEQHVGYAQWSWGATEAMPFLPRVRHGKIVVARARWRLGPADLAPIEAAFQGSSAAKTPDQIRAIRARVFAAVTALRSRLRLPRWVVIGDGDNELPVDLDNELMVDSAASLLKGRGTATLLELFPAPDQLCAASPEGALCHELVVLLETARAPRLQPVAAASAAPRPAVARRFLPGSSWLYLKIYTGLATAETVLRDHLAPAIADATARGLADRWFFLRYADPDPHLRLRFAGDPRRLTGELLPALHAALAPASEAGLVWKLAIDTYERELERYGGPAAIELAEAVFHADSACVLELVTRLAGDAASDAAWRLALVGTDRLLADLGCGLDDKLAVMTRAAAAFGAEVGTDTAFQKRLGERFRSHRAELATLLDGPATAHPLAPVLASFATRSTRIAPIGEALRALERAGQLTEPVHELAHSFIHMHVNRMIRSAPRLHEVVLYDLLRRHYEGVVARGRQLARAG